MLENYSNGKLRLDFENDHAILNARVSYIYFQGLSSFFGEGIS